MSQEPAPAFQFYPRDFLSSAHVRTMDEAARGVYITLLCVCWIEGSIPARDSEIVRLGDTSLKVWRRIRESVLVCFVERDGRYYNERLDLERHRQADRREQQRNAGLASAQHRANERSTSVQRESNSSSSSSSSSALEERTVAPPLPPDKASRMKALNTIPMPFAIIAALVRSALAEPAIQVLDEPDLMDELKTRCAKAGMTYNSEAIRKAIDSERVKASMRREE